MLIRCQRCQAVFSLQDGVAPAAGRFQVECGRCLQIFEAAAPEKTPQPPTTPAPRPADPDRDERRATADELAFALDPPGPKLQIDLGPRSSAPPSLRPKPKARSLKTALFLLAALLLAGGAFVATRARLAGLSRTAQVRMLEARRKLLRDDVQSLQEAAALFTKAARQSPDEAEPEGERAFALVLLGGTHLALADHAELRFLQEGLVAAKAALQDDAGDAAALRALALHAALSGTPDQGAGPLDQAARRAPADPWIPYTRAELLLASSPTREAREAALAALIAARLAEPRMLRAQVGAAAIAVERGEAAAARLELTRVLQQNPRHERAQRLLASLPPAP